MARNGNARKKLWSNGHRFCAYCGQQLSIAEDHRHNMLTVDHIVPRINGGITKPHNIIAACKKCNNEKGAATMPQKFSTRNGRPV